jgi:hypothetical protein
MTDGINSLARALLEAQLHERQRLRRELDKLRYLQQQGVATFNDEGRFAEIRRRLVVLDWEEKNP